jgi:hypothetical protein
LVEGEATREHRRPWSDEFTSIDSRGLGLLIRTQMG